METFNKYLDTDSALATEKKVYDRENLSKKKKSSSMTFAESGSRRSTFLDAKPLLSGGGSAHTRLGSILSTLETYDDEENSTDEDSSSNEDNNHDNNVSVSGNVSKRNSFLLQSIRGARLSILQTIRKSINLILPSSQKRFMVGASSDSAMISCLNLNEKTFRIPGCHGNSVIKVIMISILILY